MEEQAIDAELKKVAIEKVKVEELMVEREKL